MKHGKGKWKKAVRGNKIANFYEGYYEKDKKHGYGEFIWESGNKYCGNYHHDERQGYGTMTWTDGSEYKGHWIQGVQHGIGIMKFPNNNKPRAGFFERNIFIMPLRDKKTISALAGELPQDLRVELEKYLSERYEQVQKAVEDGQDLESQYL